MRNVEREAVRIANNNGAEVVDSFMDYLESGDTPCDGEVPVE
jgi:hypothetical protein